MVQDHFRPNFPVHLLGRLCQSLDSPLLQTHLYHSYIPHGNICNDSLGNRFHNQLFFRGSKFVMEGRLEYADIHRAVSSPCIHTLANGTLHPLTSISLVGW